MYVLPGLSLLSPDILPQPHGTYTRADLTRHIKLRWGCSGTEKWKAEQLCFTHSQATSCRAAEQGSCRLLHQLAPRASSLAPGAGVCSGAHQGQAPGLGLGGTPSLDLPLELSYKGLLNCGLLN